MMRGNDHSDMSCMNLLTFNVRGIKSKLKLLKMLLNRLKIHLVFLQEHFMKEVEVINIDGYTAIQKNRSKKAGGSAILVRNDLLKCNSGFRWKVHYSKSNSLEITLLEAKYLLTETKYLFSSIYLPPTRLICKKNVKDLKRTREI